LQLPAVVAAAVPVFVERVVSAVYETPVSDHQVFINAHIYHNGSFDRLSVKTAAAEKEYQQLFGTAEGRVKSLV
jgi:hypothetical protein